MSEKESKACLAPEEADTKQAINQAAEIIINGGIAAFPTETVYGLGADATNPVAVARIYQAKGRPGDNPLIMHISDPLAFWQLTHNAPDYVRPLISAFWPGPLTMVAKKKPGLAAWLGGHPKGITETIGIRMPSHPMALAVIEASGCYVAAPSANKAGTPSPTQAGHVAADFNDGSIDYILDGGPVPGGLESTVVDVTGPLPVILRPGAVTAEMIAEVTGLQVISVVSEHSADGPEALKGNSGEPPRAPGMKYRHYAPKAPMTVLVGDEAAVAAYILEETAKEQGRKVGILVSSQTQNAIRNVSIIDENIVCLILGDKAAPETIARNLYACLRQFDIIGVDEIYAEGLAQEGLGIAIMDRMKKAAEGRVVHVPVKSSIHMHG